MTTCGLTPLEWASLSPESRANLKAALVRAYYQGATDQHRALESVGLPAWALQLEDERNIERAAKGRLANGTLGEPERVPFSWDTRQKGCEVIPDYEALGAEIGRLVASKQKQYGDSFATAPKILALLYPDGVPVSAYPDLLTIVRILDKLKRVATRHESDDESPYLDISGYALLALAGERQPVIRPQNDVIGRTRGAKRCDSCNGWFLPTVRAGTRCGRCLG